ncbi:hypothetical protein K2X30_01420 [bacterium]|jgi:hypothetical protein|nr:hypothetical protein [bacterium]
MASLNKKYAINTFTLVALTLAIARCSPLGPSVLKHTINEGEDRDVQAVLELEMREASPRALVVASSENGASGSQIVLSAEQLAALKSSKATPLNLPYEGKVLSPCQAIFNLDTKEPTGAPSNIGTFAADLVKRTPNPNWMLEIQPGVPAEVVQYVLDHTLSVNVTCAGL